MSLLDPVSHKFDPEYAWKLVIDKDGRTSPDEMKLAVFGLFIWTCAYSESATSPAGMASYATVTAAAVTAYSSPSAEGKKEKPKVKPTVEHALHTLSKRILLRRLSRKVRPPNSQGKRTEIPSFSYIISRMQVETNEKLYESVVAPLGGLFHVNIAGRLSNYTTLIKELRLLRKTDFDIIKYIILECENSTYVYTESDTAKVRSRVKTALGENIFNRSDDYYRDMRKAKREAHPTGKTKEATTAFFDAAIDKMDPKSLLAFCFFNSFDAALLKAFSDKEKQLNSDGKDPANQLTFNLYETKHMAEGGCLHRALYEGLKKYGYYLNLMNKNKIGGKIPQVIEIFRNVEACENLDPIMDVDYQNFIAFPRIMARRNIERKN